jgi:uncharacterized protein (TIGR02231 family)
MKTVEMIKSILFLMLLNSLNAFAQNTGIVVDDFVYTKQKENLNEIKLQSSISNIVVFNNEAQINRFAQINLERGIHQIVFDNLSPFLIKSSIELKTDSSVDILDVSLINQSEIKNDKTAYLQELEDSLERINSALADFKADKETIVFQKDLMLANKNVGSNQTGVKTDELDDLMDLYKKRLDDFKINWFRLSKLENKYNEAKNQVQELINHYYNENVANGNRVVVTLKTDKAVSKLPIFLSYLVTNVSWNPFYEVRLKSASNSVQFNLKANLFQNTGENWENVKLTFSPLKPSENGVKPELETNWLGFYENNIQVISQASKLVDSREIGDSRPAYKSNTIMDNGKFNTTFTTKTTYTIPNANQGHLIELHQFELPAIFNYAVVPKLSANVFTTAKIAANELLNQMGGEANVYADGQFFGKTIIKPSVNDTFEITLGKEARILAEKNKLKSLSSKSFFGGSKTEQSAFEINIKNSLQTDVFISVEDQIPVSKSNEIEVKLINQDGATFNPETGKLTWNLLIPANKSKTVKFEFSVKYPKDKKLTNY